MNAFSRRGACPALSAPMQTGDGLLVRLNPLARGISPNALIGLCKAALGHGNGVMEVTARGSLQIRGLTVESAPLLAAEVDALGIAVRTGVPVQTGPLAGLDPEEIADPGSLAERIRTAIKAAGLEARLGPKVSVVVDGGGRSGMDAVLADVRLTAVRRGQDALWQIAIAGNSKTAASLGTVEEDIAFGAAMAVLSAIAALGLAARARDLTEGQLGLLGKSSQIQSSTLRPATIRASDSFARPGLLLCILPLTDGRYSLGVALPFGHSDAERLTDFARQAGTLGVSEIRLAPQRSILALCRSRASAIALRHDAERLGFVVDASDPRRQVAACPGAPACASGHIAARDLATEIAKSDGDILDASFALHISGCAKGCAHPGEAALTLVGSENGAGIVVGGTAKSLPDAYIPGQDFVRAFNGITGLIRREKGAGEDVAACISRLGKARVAEAFGKRSR